MGKDVRQKILKKLKAETGVNRNIQLPKQSIKFEFTTLICHPREQSPSK